MTIENLKAGLGAYVQCPFCKENDFDFIGLKQHFKRGWCHIYNETLSAEEDERLRREAEKKANVDSSRGTINHGK